MVVFEWFKGVIDDFVVARKVDGVLSSKVFLRTLGV
jgi:hypothetical protein